MRKYLREGLREHDLADLVIPMVSIDEFESKVDDDAIVIGFFVKDFEPANDLNRFIQKSPVVLLDTDVSPAPNEDGYFLVFVEVSRDPTFAEKFLTILDEISNLVEIDPSDWRFTCYQHDGVFEVTEEKVKVLIRTESIEDLKQKAFDDELLEFFKNSVLDNVQLNEGNLSLIRGTQSVNGELVYFGSLEDLSESIRDRAVNLTEEANRSCRTFEKLLGEGWLVHQLGDIKIVSSVFDSNVLVIRG